MEPNADGSYQANSVLFPLRLYWRMRMKKPRAGEPGGASEIVGTVSCAGAIRGLEHAFSEEFRVVLAA
jgi:hypothetical protein